MAKKILSLLFLSLSFLAHGQYSWELLNPKPSYNSGNDVYFISDQKGFIVTDDELLETTDAGETWNLKHPIFSGNEISFRDSIGYIVGNAAVYKSEDYGETWMDFNNLTDDILNTVTIFDNNIAFISGKSLFIKTTDGGNSWESFSFPNNMVVNKTFFVSQLVGHAACQSGTILKTIDGGQSWYVTESTNVTPSDFETIYFVNENVGFASRDHHDLLKTIDGGESWTVIEQEIPFTEKITKFQFLNEDIGYACAKTGVVYKTTNGGNEWEIIVPLGAYYYDSDFNSLFFTDENNGYLVGARGRIMKTTDGMATYTNYSPFYNTVSQLFPVTQNTIYASAYEKFYKSTDGGNNWQNAAQPISSDFATNIKSDFVNENTGYSIGYGYVYKTTDGAATWTTLNNGNELFHEGLYSIDFINENTGYVCGGGSNFPRMFKTVNGGSTWQQISNYSFSQLQFINEQVGYALNNGNRMYKTTNGGATWTLIKEVDSSLNHFHFINENTGYLAGHYFIYKTTDGGITWEMLNSPGASFIYIKFITPETGFVAGDYGEFYKTTNGGDTWQHVITNVGDTIMNSSIGITTISFKGTTIYIGGQSGRILKSTVPDVILGNDTNIYDTVLLNLQPNPACDKVVLTTNRNIESAVLTDISGRVIMKLKNTLATNSMSIILSGKPAGIYLVKALFTDGTSAVQKLIIK